MKGRQKGEKPKYTVGIGYVVALRAGRTPEQIAKFFKASKNTVIQTLKRHGEDADKEKSKKIKIIQSRIEAMQHKLAILEGKAVRSPRQHQNAQIRPWTPEELETLKNWGEITRESKLKMAEDLCRTVDACAWQYYHQRVSYPRS
jgi:transposase